MKLPAASGWGIRKIILNYGAERHHYSMFNVGRSMFDVHLSKQLSAYGGKPPIGNDSIGGV